MDDFFDEIIEYMKNNIDKEIKIEQMAKHFGYSKYHFSREFKRFSGVSPNEYIRGLRILKGIEVLIDGDSVTDSQLEAGYNSLGTFSNTFTKNTGLSPKNYIKKINDLFKTVKNQEVVNEDEDSLFYRNPQYPAMIAPYKLTVHIKVPEKFKGIVFSGLFSAPNPNHQPAMGRCRVKDFTYEFYHLPEGTYYPLACGIEKSLNPFHYFQLQKALRACDGQSITFPLKKNEELTLKLRQRLISDPPLVINLPNILSTGIKQQAIRNKKKVYEKISNTAM